MIVYLSQRNYAGEVSQQQEDPQKWGVGKKILAGTGGVAAAGGLFFGARKGMLGNNVRKTVNNWYISAGKKLGNSGMVKSGLFDRTIADARLAGENISREQVQAAKNHLFNSNGGVFEQNARKAAAEKARANAEKAFKEKYKIGDTYTYETNTIGADGVAQKIKKTVNLNDQAAYEKMLRVERAAAASRANAEYRATANPFGTLNKKTGQMEGGNPLLSRFQNNVKADSEISSMMTGRGTFKNPVNRTETTLTKEQAEALNKKNQEFMDKNTGSRGLRTDYKEGNKVTEYTQNTDTPFGFSSHRDDRYVRGGVNMTGEDVKAKAKGQLKYDNGNAS